MLFQRLLVANRGEIAVRIFRAATELEIRTIAIYSHEDRFSLHRFKADEAYQLGEAGKPVAAYLDWQNIVEKAKSLGVDAIHPGYGFLSENADFAQACEDAGIVFIGPSPKLLNTFGDKILAKKAAAAAKIPLIPGSEGPLTSLEEALKLAKEIGYPITLKALAGGGGRGIRNVLSEKELKEAYPRAQSEAFGNFGKSEIYLEKTIVSPKHIEVQILGDRSGNIVHLFERDCSIQRRNQKVVEMAPSIGLKPETLSLLYKSALDLAKSVNYFGLGTVEFLVDQNEEVYFLEVNPRIQVEHTVTEVITGVDLAQASIVVAAGRPLSHPAIGIKKQEDISYRGFAIQCRITSEDPKNNFAADSGKMIAYRAPGGFGVRLDGGVATAGAEITSHYDSLLVKLTTFGKDIFSASRKMLRGLDEFRIRGIKTNIDLLRNVIAHPQFQNGSFTTGFLEANPEVFQFRAPKDRATKILKFLGEATVNNIHDLPSRERKGEKETPKLISTLTDSQIDQLPVTAKEIFTKGGTSALIKWIQDSKNLLLTDTTMRDAHQSLFATRMRTTDILQALPYYQIHGHGFFSLEVWGGATFDTALRFLKEDPWQRLADMRSEVPNTLLQMLLRGDNAVGYKNYPEWVVRDFIRLTVEAGLDLFRVFDCLNNPSKMEIAIDEIKKRGAIAEACVCYTGNVIDPLEKKYTLKYYVDLAHQLVKIGSDIICIKDMAGLLRPDAARVLIKTLREEVGVPIHLHTHATAGCSEATLLAAADVGCEIVDGAISSMSGLTSQPSLNAVVGALENNPRKPAISLATLDKLGIYWEVIRSRYEVFDPGIRATSTRVYTHEIPGGQYSNLYDQARRVGLSASDFFELTQRYKEVNDLFYGIIKVTPSSKVVGDFALLLQKSGLTGPELMEKKPKLDYPDSVLSFFRGEMGVPYGGFNEELKLMVLGPSAHLSSQETKSKNDDDNLEIAKKELEKKLKTSVTDRMVLSYRLYPKVFIDYWKHLQAYGDVTKLPTLNFLYGLEQNEEISFDIEPGKTLVISLRGISEEDKEGVKTIFFDLNGYSRLVKIADQSSAKESTSRQKGDPDNQKHVVITMPGKVLQCLIKVGEQVNEDQVLFITEAMKMEYEIKAKTSGKIEEILAIEGEQFQGGDLLARLS